MSSLSVLRRKTDEDLFAESTMTFGQHLEELRARLFQAVVGLLVGTIAGLWFGTVVVDIIQQPLRRALLKYYERQTAASIDQRIAAHDALPADRATLADLTQQGFTYDEVLVDRQQLLSQFRGADGEDRERPPLRAQTAAPATDGERNSPPPKETQTAASDVGSPTPSAALRDAPAAKSVPGDMIRLFLWRQLRDDPRIRIKSLSAQESFMIYMKASLLVGAILASPWIFYQLWSFVASGLYRNERRYVYIFLPFSLALFLAGAGLAFFFVFDPVLDFLFRFNGLMGIDPDPRISEWIGFVLFMPLGFGISFQLPLVMLFVERIGIMTVRDYLEYWRTAILVIFVLAMVLTPSGDPYSMLLMALPLSVLYFGGVLLCRYLPRSQFSRFDI